MKMKAIAAAAALMALPALSQAGEIAGFTTSGYVDASYQTNDFHGGNSGAVSIGNIGGHDDFSLNQVAVTLAKQPASGFGAVINAVMGDQVSNFGGVQSNGGGGELALAQGYAQYADGGLTIMGGKFFTLAGYEVFASTGNNQATRGLLFGIQPFTLTGVRASYKIGDLFTLTGGVVNERDGSTTDANDPKAVEFQIAMAPAGMNIALTHYATSESALTVLNNFTDIVLSTTMGSFSMGLNVDIASGDDAADTKQTGMAAYGSVAVSDTFKLSLRFETLTNEASNVETKQSEITVTGGFALAKDFDLLAEVRQDKFDDAEPFVDGDGNTDDAGMTVALKGIYKF